jgi:Protein of unknown function (DUF2591)
MLLKSYELTGKALDWAVAKAQGFSYEKYQQYRDAWLTAIYRPSHWKPSEDWSQCGPIIERERLEVTPWGVDGEWRAQDFYEPSPGVPCAEQYGPTPLIAAMRCYVTSKLGDEIEIPEILLKD